jgi:hypothetical protein
MRFPLGQATSPTLFWNGGAEVHPLSESRRKLCGVATGVATAFGCRANSLPLLYFCGYVLSLRSKRIGWGYSSELSGSPEMANLVYNIKRFIFLRKIAIA